MVIGLLGLGVIGESVCEMLDARSGIRVKYVCRPERAVRFETTVTRELRDLLEDPEVEAVAELSCSVEPALEQVRQCLLAGKHVVTSNKPLMANHWNELMRLAAERDLCLRFGGAAAGGIAWIPAIERCCRADTVHEISGIMNGTTNYILDAMHLSPVNFQTALNRSKDFGYAEIDTAADVDGFDSLHRLILSANTAFDVSIPPEQVLVRGIRCIQRRDVETFLAHGFCCRLIASAEHYADGLAAVVEPTLVEMKDPEAAVHSNINLLTMVSRQAGKQSFFGQGAGRYPTAYNVVQDLLDVAAGRAEPARLPRIDTRVDNRTFVRKYYIRTAVSEPWLWSRTEERWESGVITCRLSAQDLHAWAAEARMKDPELFFAALR